MELQGTIKKISDVQTFGSGFQKRELVLLTQEQYPQPINIEFLQEKINLLDNLSEGENIKVSINIRGREWTSPDNVVKYFNSITGWKVEKLADNTDMPVQASPKPAATASAPDNTDPFADDEEDDLPF